MTPGRAPSASSSASRKRREPAGFVRSGTGRDDRPTCARALPRTRRRGRQSVRGRESAPRCGRSARGRRRAGLHPGRVAGAADRAGEVARRRAPAGCGRLRRRGSDRAAASGRRPGGARPRGAGLATRPRRGRRRRFDPCRERRPRGARRPRAAEEIDPDRGVDEQVAHEDPVAGLPEVELQVDAAGQTAQILPFRLSQELVRPATTVSRFVENRAALRASSRSSSGMSSVVLMHRA